LNHKAANIITNFSYSLGANIITFIISVIIIGIVPKVLGIEEYGYFQLYLFYTSYAIFFHLGLPNGIYLRYGGKEFSNLNKGLFTMQFWMITIYALLLAAIGSMIIVSTLGVEDKGFILIMTCLCGVIIIPRDFILLTLQATNRIKDYVKATIIDRIVFITLAVVFLILGDRECSLLIKADIYGKLAALVWLVYHCKDMVFEKSIKIQQGLQEALKNISSGSKILASNIADLMIIGIMRMGIENKWDIETFGKVSLTLSLSNLMMVVINAISIVIYPMLRRTPQDELSKYYGILRNILMVPLLGIIVVYYPMKEVLALWLPRYANSLTYMALLFPICIYESKMSMLVNTYLKNLRKEKWILIVNVVSVFISFIMSLIAIFLLNNLTLTIVSIVLVLAFRCIFAEIILSKFINIKVKKDILLELLMCTIFMTTGWLIRSYFSTLFYAACYLVYLFIKRKDIIEAKQEIKAFANSQ